MQVRKYTWLLDSVKNKDIEDVLILSGDHLYRMDYRLFLQRHRQSDADITIACLPMDYSRASDFGLMKIDGEGRVIDFAEKPKGEELEGMKVDTTVLGLGEKEAEENPFIASMGIYCFRKEVLITLLRDRFPTANDFGSEVIPRSKDEYRIVAHLFQGYWEDIGTIRSFFDANIALCSRKPKFEFFDAKRPIYSSARFLPPSKIFECDIKSSIIAHGSYIGGGCKVTNSVVGIRSYLDQNCQLEEVLMMGSDYYESLSERDSMISENCPPLGVGKNTIIRTAILDKNSRIGKAPPDSRIDPMKLLSGRALKLMVGFAGRDCVIVNSAGVQECAREEQGFFIRSGILTVLKNATIADNTHI
eukprot:scaffold1108_cov387-Prasinococcus_capsulatus_cf.AAC.9